MKNAFLPAVAALAAMLPFSAHALSCAWPSVEEALEQYPVTVLGKVTATETEELEDGAKNMLLSSYQHVTMAIEELRLAEEFTAEKIGVKDNHLTFREAVTMYDSSFYKPNRRYVVFLQWQDGVTEDEPARLVYPVCGFHLDADDDGLDMEQVKQDMGW